MGTGICVHGEVLVQVQELAAAATRTSGSEFLEFKYNASDRLQS